MIYELYETEEFKKKFEKEIPINIQKNFRKQIKKLKYSPFGKGKPLGTKFLRELKIKGFRVYYLIYKNKLIVILVSASNKKNQKEVIKKLKEDRELIKEFIKNPNFFKTKYL